MSATSPFEQHFIVDGKFLGVQDRDYGNTQEQFHAPISVAYFCPVCGDLWARCPVIKKATGKLQEFHVWKSACKKHHWLASLDIPGSILLRWEDPFKEELPAEVIRWEFDRHIALYPE